MTKAPEIAPALPSGCVDFNKLHDGILKGDPDAVAKAVVVPESEKPPAVAKAPSPVPAAAVKAGQ